MSLYIKVDRFFGTNAKMANVGLVGFAVLLQLDAEHLSDPNEGVVSALRASPKQLRLRLAAFGISEKQVAKALTELEAEGIVQVLEDGAVRMLNWKEWSDRPKTNAEKCKGYRERRKVSETPTDTDRHHGEVLPTPSKVSRHPQEQPRAEQSRANARARAHEGAPPPATPVGEPAAPDGESPARAGPDGSESASVLGVLNRAGFSRSLNERLRVRDRLVEAGCTGDDAGLLWSLAQSGDDPRRLFAHWLRQGLWRSVLDEHRAKRKESRLLAAGRRARDGTDDSDPQRIGESLNGLEPHA